MLDRANDLSRSFREETMTDILMGGLVSLRAYGVTVDFPVESQTGADMEWIFAAEDGSSHFTLLIQAKRLYGSGAVWSRRSYPEIFHRVGGLAHGKLQSSLLVSEAARRYATFPLYLFYTHKSVRDTMRIRGMIMHSLSFAGGKFIDGLVKDKQSGKLSATRTSNLRTIHPRMFSISKILCPKPRRYRIANSRLSRTLELLEFDRQALVSRSSISPATVRSRLVQAIGDDDIVPPLGEGPLPLFPYDEGLRSRYKVVFVSPPEARTTYGEDDYR